MLNRGTSSSDTAHPRSRGENSVLGDEHADVIGSSPLTRGKLELGHPLCRGERLIPAHAGKTRPSSPSCPSTRAHPRSRGENSNVGPGAPVAFGSSPLTRGKQRRCPRRSQRAGLIPAHAGKTYCRKCGARLSQAHPRSRGENASVPSLASALVGSSPLTRGKLASVVSTPSKPRLIPAHAGKTGCRLET